MEYLVPPVAEVATTFEVFPERIDLVAFVLQSIGLFALLGTAWSLLERRKPQRSGRHQRERIPRTEYATLFGALVGVGAFFLLIAIQEIF